MKISDLLNDYYTASATLSSINRQIAFAGIGVVWLFVNNHVGILSIERSLYTALICFVSALAFDMCHYIYQSIMLSIAHRYYECKYNNKPQKTIPFKTRNNIPTWFFFILKVLCTIIGYVKLIVVLVCKLIVL